jgi:hypothetical protein
MKLKLKDFSQFFEEADIKKNIGLPKDFTSKAEEEATRNLGINIDQPTQSRLIEYANKADQLMVRSIPKDNIEEKYTQLENLAKKVIETQYKAVFEFLPIELDIRLIRPGESIMKLMPELGKKQEQPGIRPEYKEESDYKEEEPQSSEDDETQTQSQSEEDDFFDFFGSDESEQEENEESDLENIIEEPEVTNKDVAMAVDKTQILNMITQGAGKATKDIIKFSELISSELKNILGDNSGEILKLWGLISDEADKSDWATPMHIKSNLFKDKPEGISGAVRVLWESKNISYELELLKENSSYNKIVIKAFGVDFPMLIHEAVKGVYMILQSPAIKKNKELAEEIKMATSSYMDEASDFRYGPLAQKMFRDFIYHCKDANRYPNMVERVLYFLAMDKEVIQRLPDMTDEEFELKNKQNGKFSDAEFLEITKSLFSSFNKVIEGGRVEFTINEDEFSKSIAKTKIEELIKEEVDFEEEMERMEREKDLKSALPSENEPKQPEATVDDEEDEIEKLKRATAERESDYANMSDDDLMDMAFQAAADGDIEKAKMIRSYIKNNESLIIIDNEFIRINENRIQISEFILNENVDKSKKFMKDTYILTTAFWDLANKVGLDNLFTDSSGEKIVQELGKGEKKILTPSDFVSVDPEKRKELFEIMKKIPFDDNKLRQLTTPPEGKSKERNIKEVEFYDYQKIREIKTTVGDKEYQLDRDNIGWLFNFVYFYYAENISLEDLTNLYHQLIENKDILNLLDKPFDLNFIDIKISNNNEKLIDSLNKLPGQRAYKKLESDLPPHLKRELKDAPNYIKDQFKDLASSFSELDPELYKGFWGQMMMDDREGSKTYGQVVFRSPISRFKTIIELIQNANGYLNACGNSSFDEFYKKLQACNMKWGASGASEVFFEKNILILEVRSYEANRILNGHTTHCIVTSRGQWESYVNQTNGRLTYENKQYYIYNFNLPSTNNMWTIGVTIQPNPRNYIRAAHNKTDGNVASRIVDILKEWGREYDINADAEKKARELGASDSDISNYGPVFSLMRPLSNEELERRRKAREAEIEITKPGKTIKDLEEYVKKWGASINHLDYSTKKCALDWAVQEDDLEKAKYILEMGADPNVRKIRINDIEVPDKKTAVINSAKSLDMIKLLISYQSIVTPVVYEATSDDVKAVEYLLDNNVDPNFENSLPVRRSCKGSFDDRNYSRTGDKGEPYIDTLKLLIERGVKLSDARGRIMILKWASEYGRGEILQICDEIGIDFGWIAAYTWANNSMKLNNKDLKEFAPLIITYIEKYEAEQWKALSNDKKWHLQL